MNKPYQAPLNGQQKQLLQARKEATALIRKQVEILSELRAYQRRCGGKSSKNLNVSIKFLKAFVEEVARGDYDRCAIAVVLKEVTIVSTDGSTPALPDPAE